MKRRFAARAAVTALGALTLMAGTAAAHPMDFGGDSWINSGLDVHWKSHGAAGSVAGRQTVPARQEGLKLVSKFDLGGQLAGAGRVADVSAKGDYAYLTMFYEPTCGRGGVQIVDMNLGTPADDAQALGYIPSHTDTFSGEGSQVVSLDTPSFKGDLLVYQNEWCPGTTNGVGGISLVDVTNPNRPKKLVEGAGDFTKKDGSQSNGVPQTRANETHSAFAWTNKETGKVYVVLVDDLEELDVDILDITDPSRPKIVSETNLDQFAQTGPTRPHGDSVFSHDMVVKRIGSRDIMLMSYWDGGYVTLDVTDPASPKPLSDTDFAATDPARADDPATSGLTPEGNAHEAEFTRDDKFFFATDEDFDPFRVVAAFRGGPAAGKQFTAIQAGDAKAISKANPLAGDTRYLGLGCDPVAAATGEQIAVVERGVCDFQVKLDNIEAAGYTGLIVFNRTGVDGCETLVNMLASSETTPAIFVSRTDGFRLLGVEPGAGYTCDSSAAAGGTSTPAGPSVPVDISAVFDGWGYTHMYKTNLAEGAKMQEVDFYAPPENQDEAYAENFGDMSVHEVATDPDKNLVYVSHYALGMRVLSYTGTGLKEVGAFVEAGGSNYWGVEVHKFDGKTYILGSDRDRGLRIFTFGG